MIAFKDFVPGEVEKGGFLKSPVYEPVSGLVQAANTWMKEAGIRPLNVETVLVPNLHQEAPSTGGVFISIDAPRAWFQVVRVWYEAT